MGKSVLARRRAGAWRGSTRTLWAVTVPNTDDLPRLRVLFAFPAVLLLLGMVLVALSLNGSSSGIFHDQLDYGNDENLVAGHPLITRSDEWNVQTVWAIAQVQQGFPVTNETFPGGMDTTLPQDLPRADWTVAFRPHLLAFLVFDVDHAFAFKWWLPGLALAGAAYAFLVSVLPRRPFSSAAIATGFFFSPLFHWWYLSTTLWPVAWALTVMAALVWTFRASGQRSRWVWAGIVAYLTVVMAMGIYVPFIVPVVLVTAFFAVGLVIDYLQRGGTWRGTVALLTPLIIAGVAASLVTLVWLGSKRAVVDAFLGTAYPGARTSPTGSGDLLSFASAVGSSFTRALNAERPGLLGQNASEASTFFYVGVFLLPVVLWIVVHRARQRQALPWPLIALAGVVVILLAYLFVPGWDGLSHLFLLQTTPGNRVRIGIGLASLALLAYCIRHFDQHQLGAPRWLAYGSALLFLLSQTAIAVVAFYGTPKMLAAAPLWWLWAGLSAAAIVLFARIRPTWGAAAFLIVTVAGSGLTNPVYRGVLDLRETAVSRTIVATNAATPSTWVAVGSQLSTALVVESGARAYNGFQGAPSRTMWDAIDPAGAFEYQWNRLAGVSWVPGVGEPQVSNPAADQIQVTFDGCSDFAQANVDFVLSDDQQLNPACLFAVDSFELPKSTITILKVVAPG